MYIQVTTDTSQLQRYKLGKTQQCVTRIVTEPAEAKAIPSIGSVVLHGPLDVLALPPTRLPQRPLLRLRKLRSEVARRILVAPTVLPALPRQHEHVRSHPASFAAPPKRHVTAPRIISITVQQRRHERRAWLFRVPEWRNVFSGGDKERGRDHLG